MLVRAPGSVKCNAPRPGRAGPAGRRARRGALQGGAPHPTLPSKLASAGLSRSQASPAPLSKPAEDVVIERLIGIAAVGPDWVLWLLLLMSLLSVATIFERFIFF